MDSRPVEFTVSWPVGCVSVSTVGVSVAVAGVFVAVTGIGAVELPAEATVGMTNVVR